jgi:hypothetical protein
MDDEVPLPGRVLRRDEPDAQARRDRPPGRVDVHQFDVRPRQPAGEVRHAAADHPRPDDGDPVTHERTGVPQRVDGGLHRPREDGAAGGDAVRHGDDGRRGDDVPGPVRDQGEDDAPGEVRRALLDDTDVEVPVLDGCREGATLEGCPHRVVLTGRHLAAKHEGLGAATDPGGKGPDHDVARRRLRQRDLPDLPAAGSAHPEGAGGAAHRHRTGREDATWCRVCASLIVPPPD